VINKKEALVDPQLWNLYSYCGNKPITFYDPNGEELKKVTLSTLKGTKNFFSYLDDSFSPLVNKFVKSAKNAGIDITFRDAFRPEGEQKKRQKNKSSITPAKAGTSLHESGFAVDINWSKIPKNNKKKLIKLANKAGLSWGGNFKKPDNVHFYKEVPGGRKNRSKYITSARKEYKK